MIKICSILQVVYDYRRRKQVQTNNGRIKHKNMEPTPSLKYHKENTFTYIQTILFYLTLHFYIHKFFFYKSHL